MLHVGVDLSARRGFDVAVMDDGRRVHDVKRILSLDALVGYLAGLNGALTVAIDAPQAPELRVLQDDSVRASLGLPAGRYRRYRLCDYELARRGMPLYLLPAPEARVPPWMDVGFATFNRLRRDFDLALPAHNSDVSASLLEVYPFASFVTMLGGRPPRKTTAIGRAARVGSLEQARVSGVPDNGVTHDTLDAIVAAYTAWAWRHGQGTAVGDPGEGLIVLPVTAERLKARYITLNNGQR